MISVEQALSFISEQRVDPKSKILDITSAVSYCLAEPVIAPLDVPLFDNSAMDGYAICGEGVQFRVIGEVAAGQDSREPLQEGEAMRIFTGAKVPAGTTAVIMQEKVTASGEQILLQEAPKAGTNIRRRGEEMKSGDLVFETGYQLNPAGVGLLLSLGITEVRVFEPPKVSILVTGNELVLPGEPLSGGQIYESNSNTLKAALTRYDVSEISIVRVADDPDSTKKAVTELLEQSDLLLVSGGISVGDYDFVKKALEDNRVEEVFYKVNQKPGKPLYFGKKDQTFVFGLPGNPASGLTCFYIYVLPLLQKMAGGKHVGLTRVRLKLDRAFSIQADRAVFLKGLTTGPDSVTILDGQSSSMLFSLSVGNTLVFLPGRGEYQAETLVECYLY